MGDGIRAGMGAGHFGGADPGCPQLALGSAATSGSRRATGPAGRGADPGVRPCPCRRDRVPGRPDYLRVWTAGTALTTFRRCSSHSVSQYACGAGTRPEGAMDAVKRAGEQFRQGESGRALPAARIDGSQGRCVAAGGSAAGWWGRPDSGPIGGSPRRRGVLAGVGSRSSMPQPPRERTSPPAGSASSADGTH